MAGPPSWLAGGAAIPIPEQTSVDPLVQTEPAAPDAPPSWLAGGPERTKKQRDIAVQEATKTDPDKFAGQLNLSRESGLPVEAVEPNQEVLEQQRKAAANSAALDGSPATERWLFSSPTNLKLASDSVESLSAIEKMVKDMRDTAKEYEDRFRKMRPETAKMIDELSGSEKAQRGTAQSVVAGHVRAPGQWIRGLGDLNAVASRALAKPLVEGLRAAGLDDVADAVLAPLPWWLNPTEILRRGGGVVEQAGEAIDVKPEDRGFINDVGGGVGQVSAQITAVLLSGGLSSAVSTAMLIGQGAAQAQDEVKKASAEGTAGGDASVVAGAAITAITERYGLDALLNKIPAAMRSRIARVLSGASTEAVQEISEKVLNNLTALLLYDSERNIISDDVLYEGGVGGAVGALVSAVIPGRQAIRVKKQLDQTAETVQKSALAQRDPEAAASHVAEALREADAEIYIPAEKLAEIAGTDAQEAQAFYEELGIADVIQGALDRGGDVLLSEDVFAKSILLDPARYEALSDHIRVGQDAMNASEAEALKDQKTEVPAEAEAEAGEVTPGEDVQAEPQDTTYKYEPMDVSMPTEGRVFYHGTKADLKSLANVDVLGTSKVENLYGEGLYLTDSEKVAKSYAANKGRGKEGKVLSAALKNLRLIDLESPLPQVALTVYARELGKYTGEKAEALSTISGKEVFSRLKNAFADEGLTTSEVQEIYSDINVNLADLGFDGLRYEGGKFRGRDTGPHNVVILFDTPATQNGKYIGGAAKDKFSALEDGLLATEAQRKKLEKAGFSKDEIDQMSPQDTAGLLKEKPKPDKFHFQPEDQPVQLAEEQMGLQGLFNTAREAGMTNSEYNDYLVQRAQASEAAVQKFRERMLKQRLRENEEAWKAAKERETEEVRVEAERLQVYQAFDGIGAVRLDQQSVIDAMGEEPVNVDGVITEPYRTLPKQDGRAIVAPKSETGVDVNVYAQEYGYEDGAAMLNDFLLYPAKAEYIASEVDRRMKDKFGDLTNERQAAMAALEDLHNDKQADILAAELNALRNARKEKRLTPKLFRTAAREKMVSLKLSQVNTPGFLAEEVRKGKLAGKLLREGNRAGAAQAKFQQLLNFQYAKEAFAVRSRMEQRRRKLEKLSNPAKKQPGIDADYLDQLHNLLSSYNFNKVKPKAADFGGQTHYSQLTLDQWNRLWEQAKRLETQGRAYKSDIKGREKDAFNLAKDKALKASQELPDIARMERQRYQQNPGLLDKGRSKLASFSAMVGKVELMLRKLDGGKIVGPWYDLIFKPLAKAQNAEARMMTDVVQKRIINGLEKLPKEAQRRLKKTYMVTSMGRKFKGSDLLMMALNVGNESNFRKLVEGSGKDNNSVKWTPQAVEEALKNLGPQEAQWVQKVWDAFEEMRPQVETVYRAETGIAPERVESRGVEIGGVKLKGGYFPMLYDQNRAPGDDRKSVLEALSDPYYESGVFSGMTQSRMEAYSIPVNLDLQTLPHAMRQHIHFITHYEAVKQVRKVVKDRDLAQAVRNKLGPEYHEELEAWLEALATNNADPASTKGQRNFNSVIQGFRSRLTIAVLGGSYTTLMAQPLGLSTAAGTIGPKWVALGLDRYVAGPKEAIADVLSMSEEMQHRVRNVTTEISESLSKLTDKSFLTWGQKTQRAALVSIGYMQFYTVDVPVWLGAYQKAIAENHADPVEYADSAVRTSQGSGHTKDLAHAQRMKGVMQIFTMFSTYTNLAYNLEVDAIGSMKKIKNVPKAMQSLAFVIVLPAIIEAFLRGEAGGEDDDESLAAKLALKSYAFAVGVVPIAGSGFKSLADGYRFSVSPLQQLPEAWWEALKTVAEHAYDDLVGDDDKDFEWDDARKILKAAGLGFGIPGTTQIDKMLRAAQEEDPGFYDFLVGPKKD